MFLLRGCTRAVAALTHSSALARNFASVSIGRTGLPRSCSSTRGIQRYFSSEVGPPGPVRTPPSEYVRFPDSSRRGPESSRAYVVIGGVAAGTAAYYVYHLDRAPYTGRIRMIDVSREQERRIGALQFQEILTQNSSAVLPPNHPTALRVSGIGRRIAEVAQQDDFDWEFVVIQSKEPNAFCLPGGKVAVFTGLLPITPDDDALASVMAHEIGHAVARHGAEKLGFMKILFLFQILLATVVDTFTISSWIVKLVGELPYSRSLESEADYIGLRLMTLACYDPTAAPRMFTRLGEATRAVGGSVPKYLSTHPNSKERVAKVESWLGEVMPTYESHCQRSYSDFVSAAGRGIWN
eukprot:Plantae.Rhodophyta-Rhodochaete_pulchella.ctg18663.p1 GENE.Plantae.Rhodophyta-Rhodochaete_pulchella.ctg18663~~Plantae.Rhodophyta-Rhodochaete_pulchella.ctg18663.p1  ORF type:complete len:366 (+),score=27.59 Plantae.Rhodophyta-Rhodochaete_pulchella.ctg18663:43-1098(+)